MVVRELVQEAHTVAGMLDDSVLCFSFADVYIICESSIAHEFAGDGVVRELHFLSLESFYQDTTHQSNEKDIL